jgi:hypothetical protein
MENPWVPITSSTRPMDDAVAAAAAAAKQPRTEPSSLGAVLAAVTWGWLRWLMIHWGVRYFQTRMNMNRGGPKVMFGFPVHVSIGSIVNRRIH